MVLGEQCDRIWFLRKSRLKTLKGELYWMSIPREISTIAKTWNTFWKKCIALKQYSNYMQWTESCRKE